MQIKLRITEIDGGGLARANPPQYHDIGRVVTVRGLHTIDMSDFRQFVRAVSQGDSLREMQVFDCVREDGSPVTLIEFEVEPYEDRGDLKVALQRARTAVAQAQSLAETIALGPSTIARDWRNLQIDHLSAAGEDLRIAMDMLRREERA